MTREVRDETLPMLLLTPHDAEEFFAGWQRGALRLAWPDIALCLGVAAVSLALDPVAPLIVLGVGGAILCSAPFVMLWGLVPFSAEGLATGLALIFVILVHRGDSRRAPGALPCAFAAGGVPVQPRAAEECAAVLDAAEDGDGGMRPSPAVTVLYGFDHACTRSSAQA
jgi:hypothetical protein